LAERRLAASLLGMSYQEPGPGTRSWDVIETLKVDISAPFGWADGFVRELRQRLLQQPGVYAWVLDPRYSGDAHLVLGYALEIVLEVVCRSEATPRSYEEEVRPAERLYSVLLTAVAAHRGGGPRDLGEVCAGEGEQGARRQQNGVVGARRRRGARGGVPRRVHPAAAVPAGVHGLRPRLHPRASTKPTTSLRLRMGGGMGGSAWRRWFPAAPGR